jgi:protein gp37
MICHDRVEVDGEQMAGLSKIEWTDSTFNPWVGCTKVDRPRKQPSACDFCYAEKWAKRSGMVKWGNYARRRTTESYWTAPIAWHKRAQDFQKRFGRRQRVFCASLADVFDNQADPAWRADLFRLIKSCDQLDWQLLTKRPQNMRKMLPADWGTGYSNVWLGTTAEDAAAYAQRVSHLLAVPAAVRFVSYEPALGPLAQLEIDGVKPDWIIIGGESGVRSDRARPTSPKWARDVLLQCERVGIAPFLKQWGAYTNNPLVVEQGLSVHDAMIADPPENGKGGGKLDGKLWRRFPTSLVGNSTAREEGGDESRGDSARRKGDNRSIRSYL